MERTVRLLQIITSIKQQRNMFPESFIRLSVWTKFREQEVSLKLTK